MSDVAPAEQDQPIEETPQGDQSQEESYEDFDPSTLPEDVQAYLQHREKQMQGDYTKKTQSVAEERRELAEMREFLEAQNQSPEDEETYEPEDEFVDPSELRLSQLEQQNAQIQEALEQQRIDNEFSKALKGLESEEDRSLSGPEKELLYDLAMHELDRKGETDVEALWGRLKGSYSEREKAAKDGLLKGKTNTPRPPAGGKAGSRTVDPEKESDEERLQRMINATDQAVASAE